MLKRLFQPPIPFSGDSFFEEAKYHLAYRMSMFLSLTLAILTCVFFVFFEIKYSAFTFIAFVGIFVGLIMIRTSGKYKKTILFFNIFAAILCEVTLYSITNTPHLADGYWMMVNIVFAFLTISVFWATVISIMHIGSTFIFYLLFYNDQISLIAKLNESQLIGFGLNILFSFSILAYLTWQNIAMTKRAEQKLSDANNALSSKNDEITLMLKEIHHRVKNNLQVIVSLLRLQSNELKNEEAIEKFKDTINRVLSMSTIHEKMYQSSELAKLDLDDYFLALGNYMIHSHSPKKSITLNIDCSLQASDLKSIVPIGLLFNELISNSLKHAFKDSEQSTITFSMYRQEEQLTISYSDSGNWTFNENKSSFGTDLIETLVDQLNGSIEFSNDPTTYVFSFESIEL